jgi:iron complex outermembrane receptor protein
MSMAGARLYRTVTLSTLAAAAVFIWNPGHAQTVANNAQGAPTDQPEGNALNEIIVTGTRIRGVEQVGSATIAVTQQDMANTGLSSTADILQQYPQLLSLGSGVGSTGAGTDAQGETLNNTFARAVNIRGVGREATLSLIDGHRVPYTGADMSFFDPDTLPVQMLQRVEVVADGTSPIYGADAVAGTVNYILRKPFTGAESYLQYGTASGENQWQAAQIFGLTWGEAGSGFVIGYQHTHLGSLNAEDRPFYSDNFSPYGGPPSSDYATPGNVIVGGTTSYAIPRGQNGTGLALASLGPAGSANTQNAWYGQQALPEQTRDSVTLNGNQKVNDTIDVFADAYYTKRDFSILQQPPNGQYIVPNSNPYSPCNNVAGAPAALTAACASGSLAVNYSFAGEVPDLRYGNEKSYYGFGGVRFSLLDNWELTLQAGSGHDSDYTNNPVNGISGLPGSPITTALASTNPATALNLFCDATAFACNPASLLNGLGAPFYTQTVDGMSDFGINVDGPLVALPGGEMRLAAGVEYNMQHVQSSNSFGVGNELHRDISSGYLELFVPVVGSGNAIPFVKKLVVDVAGRIDSYSDQLVDLGRTKNPKIGVDWSPVDEVKFHSSFGTSFRAPSMLEEDITAQHGYLALPTLGGVSVPCAGCNFPGALVPIDVGYHTTEPSTARSVSAGLDWTPTLWHGFTASVNWYKLRYYNDVDTPLSDVGYVAGINTQQFNSLYIYNPTYFPALAANNPVAFVLPGALNAAKCSGVIGKRITTKALFNAYIACVDAGGDSGFLGAPVNAAQVIAIADAEHLNSTNLNTNGLDLAISQSWTSTWGTWHVGAVAEDVLKYDVSLLPGASYGEEVNELAFPIRFKGRGQFGWNTNFGVDDMAATTFVNYTEGYHVPASDLPSGVSAQYTNVSSYTTVDAAVIYNLRRYASQFMRNGFTFSVSVQNLFNRSPPLVLNGASTGSGVLYDPANASPLQRLVQLQFAAKF